MVNQDMLDHATADVRGRKMRLICPNCGAQYEVADDVIPPEGRDVQCSNCGHTWFESHGASNAEDAFHDAPVDKTPPNTVPIDQVAPVAAPAPAEPQRQELDPAIADILREEAAREAAARQRETTVESQPDLGLDAAEPVPDQRAIEAQRRMTSLQGENANPTAELAAAAASRRELLPDIEEINSSLRSDAERDTPATAAVETTTKNRSGFRWGFFGVLFILAILTAFYVFAPQIIEQVPAVEPTLTSYVDMVDSLRLWIDLKLQSMVAAMGPDG